MNATMSIFDNSWKTTRYLYRNSVLTYELVSKKVAKICENRNYSFNINRNTPENTPKWYILFCILVNASFALNVEHVLDV